MSTSTSATISKDTLTFSKCKLGLDNVYFYFNEIVCTKIFINSDHLKIITYDEFKLPIKLLNEFLKDLGFIIYIEIQHNNIKMFRTVENKIPCNFHDIKKQFPNKITCCLNNKGLKIPGCFQMNEFINVAKNFIDYFKIKNSVKFVNVPQDFPILPKNVNTNTITTSVEPKIELKIVEPQVVEPQVVEPQVVETKVVEPQVNTIEFITTEKSGEISISDIKIDKCEAHTINMSEYERKLAIAESDINIAQIKHNIAYLEIYLQQVINYRNTL